MEEVKKEIEQIMMQKDITLDVRYGLRVAMDIIKKHYPDIQDDRKVSNKRYTRSISKETAFEKPEVNIEYKLIK